MKSPTKRADRPQDANSLITLNFKVPRDFKKSYKIYAAQREMSMLALLQEGFELSKKKSR